MNRRPISAHTECRHTLRPEQAARARCRCPKSRRWAFRQTARGGAARRRCALRWRGPASRKVCAIDPARPAAQETRGRARSSPNIRAVGSGYRGSGQDLARRGYERRRPLAAQERRQVFPTARPEAARLPAFRRLWLIPAYLLPPQVRVTLGARLSKKSFSLALASGSACAIADIKASTA